MATSEVRRLCELICEKMNNASSIEGWDEEWCVDGWKCEFCWCPEKPKGTVFKDLKVHAIPGNRSWDESTRDRCDCDFLQEIHIVLIQKLGKEKVKPEYGDSEQIDSLVALTEQIGKFMCHCWREISTKLGMDLFSIEGTAVPFDEEFLQDNRLFVSSWIITYSC